MLINATAVKSKIKRAGYRSEKKVIAAIDKKVSGMIDSILATHKHKKTLRIEDIV